jgi:transposase-like protein
MLSAGRPLAQVLQHLGVSEQTFHRWRNQYGGMKSEEADRVNDFETLLFMKPLPAARGWRVPARAG